MKKGVSLESDAFKFDYGDEMTSKVMDKIIALEIILMRNITNQVGTTSPEIRYVVYGSSLRDYSSN